METVSSTVRSTTVVGSIQQELNFGDVIQGTFNLYLRDFSKYITIFLVAETIIGILSAALQYFIVLPTLAPNATPAQVFAWLPGFLGMLVALVFGLILVSAVVGTIAAGASVKITSEAIENKKIDLIEGIRYTAQRMLSIWGLTIIVSFIVLLGVIALVIPGIILAIMFSLAFPVLIIENAGIIDSMGRSRRLVSGRWLKTFGVYLVIGLVAAVGSGIVSLMTLPITIGFVRNIADNILSAFYLPIVPIALTVYYYSNRARLNGRPQFYGALPPSPPSSFGQAPGPRQQMATSRFCSSCGEPVTHSDQAFCKKCGQVLSPVSYRP